MSIYFLFYLSSSFCYHRVLFLHYKQFHYYPLLLHVSKYIAFCVLKVQNLNYMKKCIFQSLLSYKTTEKEMYVYNEISVFITIASAPCCRPE